MTEPRTKAEAYDPAMKITDQAEADRYFETRARVERLFRCAHPIFGAIAEVGPPPAEEAFRKGLELGERAAKS